MDEHRVEMMAEQPWEETLEFLTSDMHPEEIDVEVLANRYREYLKETQELDLEVSAKAVRICAALLNLKAMALYTDEEILEEEEEEETQEVEQEEDTEPPIEVGPELEMPVKNRPQRRMSLDELKEALEDALQVQQEREQRRERRMEMDQAFEVEETDITDKLDSLMDRITSFGSKEDKVHFDRLLEQKEREEQIEKFKHVLHLENDEKVQLIQEEFLGDLHVKPEEAN